MRTSLRPTFILLALIEAYLLSACGIAKPNDIAKELSTREFSFKGVVEEMLDDQWVVSGQVVDVSRSTFPDSHVVIGDIVQVQGKVSENGSIVALKIEFVKWMAAFPTVATVMLAFLLLLIPIATTTLK